MGKVLDAIEEGHVGTGWTRNPDQTVNVAEVATECKMCGPGFPCEVIKYCRAEDSATAAKFARANRGRKPSS